MKAHTVEVNKKFRVTFSVQATWQILVCIKVRRNDKDDLFVDWASAESVMSKTPQLKGVPQQPGEDDATWGQRLDDNFSKVVKRNGDDNLQYAARLLGKKEVRLATITTSFGGTDRNFPGGLWSGGPDGEKADYRAYGSVVMPTEIGHWEFTLSYGAGHTDPVPWEVVEATQQQPLSPRRQLMMSLIDKWMPTSLLDKDQDGAGNPIRSFYEDPETHQLVPITKKTATDHLGQPNDLLNIAGWTANMGVSSKQTKDDNQAVIDGWNTRQKILKGLKLDAAAIDPAPVMGGDLKPLATSCGDVVKAMMVEWGVDWKREEGEPAVAGSYAFGIGIAARIKGYYVSAMDAFSKSPPRLPNPGDILVLRTEGPMREGKPKPPPFSNIGFLAHVCIVQSVEGTNQGDLWVTADGGSGILPDQVAKQNNARGVFKTAPSDSIDGLKVYGMPWTTSDGKGYHDRLPDKFKDYLYAPGPFPEGLVCLAHGSSAEATIASAAGYTAELVDGWVDLDRVPNKDASLGPPGPAAGTSDADYQTDQASSEKFRALWAAITSDGK